MYLQVIKSYNDIMRHTPNNVSVTIILIYSITYDKQDRILCLTENAVLAAQLRTLIMLYHVNYERNVWRYQRGTYEAANEIEEGIG
jgi:hypothetical protein